MSDQLHTNISYPPNQQTTPTLDQRVTPYPIKRSRPSPAWSTNESTLVNIQVVGADNTRGLQKWIEVDKANVPTTDFLCAVRTNVFLVVWRLEHLSSHLDFISFATLLWFATLLDQSSRTLRKQLRRWRTQSMSVRCQTNAIKIKRFLLKGFMKFHRAFHLVPRISFTQH